jgi:hypothetical protein
MPWRNGHINGQSKNDGYGSGTNRPPDENVDGRTALPANSTSAISLLPLEGCLAAPWLVAGIFAKRLPASWCLQDRLIHCWTVHEAYA